MVHCEKKKSEWVIFIFEKYRKKIEIYIDIQINIYYHNKCM